MSWKYVRDTFKSHLTTNLPTEKVLDLSGGFENIKDFLAKNGVNPLEPWIGLQYIGAEELPIDVAAYNGQGKYREVGSIYIHIVAQAKGDYVDSILQRADSIASILRARRIGTIIIESLVPANFSNGTTLDFEGGYTSAAVIVSYRRDIDL